MPSAISLAVLDQTISWTEYYTLAHQYVNTDHKPERYRDEKIIGYTGRNIRLMDQVLATINIESKLYNLLTTISRDLTWIVLTEQWCGDAAQSVPVLHMMATCTERIIFRILLTDTHPQVLDSYLTGGGRSVPKLICVDTHTLEELGVWGPRPAALRKLMIASKADPLFTLEAKIKMVDDWYAADKTLSIQQEFIDLIKQWA